MWAFRKHFEDVTVAPDVNLIDSHLLTCTHVSLEEMLVKRTMAVAKAGKPLSMLWWHCVEIHIHTQLGKLALKYKQGGHKTQCTYHNMT